MENDRRRFIQGLGALMLTAPIIGCGSSSSKEADAGLDTLAADTASPDQTSPDQMIHLKPYQILRNLEDDRTGHVKDIDPEKFDYEVLQAVPPVMVDFYAPWCGPCKYMAPIVESLAEVVVGIKFGKLDTDTEAGKKVFIDYGGFAIPYFQFFFNGEWKKDYGILGADPNALKQQIGRFIKDHNIPNAVVFKDGGVESHVPSGAMNYDSKFRNYDPKLKQFEEHYCDLKTRTLHRVK